MPDKSGKVTDTYDACCRGDDDDNDGYQCWRDIYLFPIFEYSRVKVTLFCVGKREACAPLHRRGYRGLATLPKQPSVGTRGGEGSLGSLQE